MYWRVNKSRLERGIGGEEGALHFVIKDWHRSFPFFIFMAFSLRAVPRLCSVGQLKLQQKTCSLPGLKNPKIESRQPQVLESERRTSESEA